MRINVLTFFLSFVSAEAKDSELYLLQAQLEERMTAQREAEQTLTAYSEMETEWKKLNEDLEEKVKELNETLLHRDQEMDKHVSHKERLVTQLQETSKSKGCM